MNLYFVNRFFYPDISATSQMLTDLATGLGENYEVTVITSRNCYNDTGAELQPCEVYRGVRIMRLNATRLGRARLVRRLIDYASFLFRVLTFLLRRIRKGDLVVLMTDPPLLSLLNTAAVRLRGGRVVNWVQDIFPEIAIELGAFPPNRAFSAPLIWWRNRTFKAAAVNVVLSRKMQDFLARQGVHNVVCIPNWADGESIRPLPQGENLLRSQWNADNRFIVGYSGNFGRAHSFDELVEAMRILKEDPTIRFLMIGDGNALKHVRNEVARLQLANVSFKPYQASADLAQSLGAIDLHLISLKPGMEGLLMPSKFYGALAAGRPIAFVGDPAGEIAHLVNSEGLGFVVQSGDGAGLAEQIRLLAQDPARIEAGTHNARALFDAKFSDSRAMERWLHVIQAVQHEEAHALCEFN